MKYLIFLPITLLSFGVAFGGGDTMQLVRESDSTPRAPVTDVTMAAKDSDDNLARPERGIDTGSDALADVAGASDENEVASLEGAKDSDDKPATRHIGTDYNCASEGSCPS